MDRHEKTQRTKSDISGTKTVTSSSKNPRLSSKERNLRHFVSTSESKTSDDLLNYAKKNPSRDQGPLTTMVKSESRNNSSTNNEAVEQRTRRKSYHFEDPNKFETETAPEKVFQCTEEMKSRIQQRLKTLYNSRGKSTLSLLKHSVVNAEADFSDSLQTVVSDHRGQFQKLFISLEDLFTRESGPNVGTTHGSLSKILLEGYPGFGKTTLTCKLAEDWSLGKTYLTDQFDFVFLIQLRQLRGTIEDHITSQLSIQGINSMTMQRILKRIQRDTLLILDGYDELRSSTKNFLYPILQGFKYAQMTVFMTSRPGMGLIRNYLSECHSSKNFSIPWGKIIFITGIAEERQRNFLQMNLPTESTAEVVYNRIQEEMNQEMREIYKCPLFLQLLTLLIRSYKLTIVTSKTELYKKVLTVIITQCLQDEKLIDEEINIFDPLPQKEERKFYHNLLLCLGKLALKGLKEKTFYYSKKEILDCCKQDARVFKLGLLNKTESFQKDTQEEWYEPIHKSFIEFLAGFYLSSLDSDERVEKRSLFISTVNSLMEEEVQPTNGSLFYQFLGGILGAKTKLLLKAISPWSFKYFASKYRDYSYDSYHLFYPISCILSEVKISEDLLKSLLPFLPVLWEVKKQKDSTKFFRSTLHAQLLNIATQENQTRFFSWHIDEPVTLPESLSVNTVKLEIGNTLNMGLKSLKHTNITCKELICHFVMGFNKDNWKSFMKIVSHINTQKLSVMIDVETVDSVIPSLCEEAIKGLLRDTTISRLSCSLIQNKHRSAVILLKDLVEREKITDGLQIKIQRASDDTTDLVIENKDIEYVFTAAGASTTLTELSFINMWSDLEYQVELECLCVQDKTWNFFPIRNKTVFVISRNNRKPFQVKELEFDRCKDVEEDIKIVKFTRGVQRLKCRSELFDALTWRIPSWTGFKTITEVNLKIADETYHERQLKALSNLENLQALSLDLYWVKYDDDDEEQNVTLSGNDADSLASTLFNTGLKSLEFSDVGGWNVPFVKRIVQGLLELKETKDRQSTNRKTNPPKTNKEKKTSITISKPIKNKFQLRILKIQFHDISKEDMQEFMSIFKTYLLNKLSTNICFLDPTEAQIKQIMDGFRFKDDFQIHQGVEGLEDEDTMRAQREFLYSEEEPKAQLTVSVRSSLN